MFNLSDFLQDMLGRKEQAQQPRNRSVPRAPQAPQPIQQQPRKPMAQFQAPAPTRDNMINNQMVDRGQLPESRREMYPNPDYPQMPRYQSAWQQLPRNQRTNGLPQNFLGAPQLPTFDRELNDEVLRLGGF